ncbi:beta-N-acetylhexosaminidase [Kordiimonas sp. SCSIO 12610]|uniref:beta-N-acetylhexosaminidase n=1 Tax=Kordiimonas sp. SCSIO 12610 TaxID=2829597 RepID=UPI002108AFEC|nr:beta-N-acetylhexosaminidase [Kordiimonas sp. SCSIO 12610]UTW54232.1 beta-N-acetylhexosaminidase [Kordiimonas sp. SCSIO 12610]
MTKRQPVIFGCAGLILTDEEISFFKSVLPVGYILFARNIDTPDQVKLLTDQFREISGDNTLVLIDQEGGRVQRMKPPHWSNYPTAQFFGHIYHEDKDLAWEAVALNSQLIAHDLLSVGINVDCLPVLDIPVEGSDPIIGDRAYGLTPEIVADLGSVAANALMNSGVLPVIKHIPGHGRADVDSHLSLPTVNVSHSDLSNFDFQPFKKMAHMPLAMTAHIVFSDIDDTAPATQSKRMIEDIIRGEIGFKGVLMSDDLSMQALKGSLGERTRRTFAAGCDLALHCNGDMSEMQDVASNLSSASANLETRLGEMLSSLNRDEGQNIDEIKNKYNQIVSGYK